MHARASASPRSSRPSSCLAPAASAAERKVQIYRPLTRSAAELLAPAQAALGDAGSVGVDAGTNALVLIGDASAVEAALGVLAQLDRPLATVVLHYESERLEDLAARGIRVAWSVSAGSFRVGNVHAPPGTDLVAVRPFAIAGRAQSRLAGMLRVQDGQVGRIETGTAVPIVHSRLALGVAARLRERGLRLRGAPAAPGRRSRARPAPALRRRGRAGRRDPHQRRRHRGDGAARRNHRDRRAHASRGEQRSRGLGGAANEQSYEDWLLLLRAEVEGRAPSASPP